MPAYTLHSQGSYGLAASGDTGAFTLGTEFEVSSPVTLTGIWFYSGTGAPVLPSACCLYDASTGTQISGTLNSSPSWSGAAGSGWVKCTYSGPTLASGTKYVAAVYATGAASWFWDVNGYWTTGAGSGGITNGPLSAPASSGAINGQAVYNSGTGLTFPASTVTGYDFGVDVEVTSGGGSESGPFNITLPAPAVSLAGQIGHNSTFTPVLPGPTVSLAGKIGHNSTFNIRLPAPVLTLTGHLPPPPPITVKAGGVPDSGRSPVKKLWLLGW